MEQFFKEKLNTCVNYIKNKINIGENYQLVETKRKIYYYSKFSLEISEFLEIYTMVKTLKENIFKNLVDTIKYCSKDLVIFMKEYSEKEKILIIFTVCFLHFYGNFTYENNFSFEDYFNQNLINLCTNYNVYIKDIKQFKIFCYSFYYQLIKEIKNINYQKFKNMYKYYNPGAIEEEKLICGEKNLDSKKNFTNNILHFFRNYLKNFNKTDELESLKSNLQKIVNKKIMTPLVSTTERVVDMVLSIESGEEGKSLVDNEEMEVEGESKTNTNTNTKPTSMLSRSHHHSHNNSHLTQDDIVMVPIEHDINNPTINSPSSGPINTKKSVVSKRILCELIKSDDDEDKKQTYYETSQKLDFFIDVILNNCENKIHYIQLFMCFIVEINSELIRILPENSDSTDDLNMRFIIPSKNIYNYAMEVYFSIYDLFNVDINTFMENFKKKFPFKYEDGIGKCVLFFYKILTDEILKNNNKENIRTILENAYNETFRLWEVEIIEKGQELKRFCTV